MPFFAKAHPTVIPGDSIPGGGFNFSLEDARRYFGVFSVVLYFPETPFYPPTPFRARDKAIFAACKAVRDCIFLLRPITPNRFYSAP